MDKNSKDSSSWALYNFCNTQMSKIIDKPYKFSIIEQAEFIWGYLYFAGLDIMFGSSVLQI